MKCDRSCDILYLVNHMKLSFKNTKLVTVFLIGFFLIMLAAGFYHPTAVFLLTFAAVAVLGECLYPLFLPVGFLMDKLSVQLLN